MSEASDKRIADLEAALIAERQRGVEERARTAAALARVKDLEVVIAGAACALAHAIDAEVQ